MAVKLIRVHWSDIELWKDKWKLQQGTIITDVGKFKDMISLNALYIIVAVEI